jgi:hypothetical protein
MVELPDHLEQRLLDAAQRAGPSLPEHVVPVLTSDQATCRGTWQERLERANALAPAAHRRWVDSGRRTDGGAGPDEAFA